jgi:hypothetical protein
VAGCGSRQEVDNLSREEVPANERELGQMGREQPRMARITRIGWALRRFMRMSFSISLRTAGNFFGCLIRVNWRDSRATSLIHGNPTNPWFPVPFA